MSEGNKISHHKIASEGFRLQIGQLLLGFDLRLFIMRSIALHSFINLPRHIPILDFNFGDIEVFWRLKRSVEIIWALCWMGFHLQQSRFERFSLNLWDMRARFWIGVVTVENDTVHFVQYCLKRFVKLKKNKFFKFPPNFFSIEMQISFTSFFSQRCAGACLNLHSFSRWFLKENVKIRFKNTFYLDSSVQYFFGSFFWIVG